MEHLTFYQGLMLGIVIGFFIGAIVMAFVALNH